ncbi:MAG: lysophospholipid acyltransferase family protein [Candidatus Helarchaeota archaeon]
MGKVNLPIRLFRKFIHFFFRPEIIGFNENIPKKGGALIAANHGGYELDTFILSCITKRWIHVLYWDIYYYEDIYYYIIQFFKIIPVNIPSHKVLPGFNINNSTHIALMKKFFKKGNLVGIFPEGDSNTVWQAYQLHRFLPGVSKLAIKCEVPVIPTAIIGIIDGVSLIFKVPKEKSPSLVAIPAPIIFPKKLIIHFGEPIYFDKFYGKEVSKTQHFKNANLIRAKVGALLKTHGKDPKL